MKVTAYDEDKVVFESELNDKKYISETGEIAIPVLVAGYIERVEVTFSVPVNENCDTYDEIRV